MKLLLPLLFLISLNAYGVSDKNKKSGYKYIIQNYFSKKRSNLMSYHGAPRQLTLYIGSSLYRETKNDIEFPFLDVLLGLDQRLKELSAVGDINLQIGLHKIRLTNQKSSMAIAISPRFILPDLRSGFPIYVGLGIGMQVFPRHILQDLPSLTFNTQFFTGIRLLDIYHNVGIVGELSLKAQPIPHVVELSEVELSEDGNPDNNKKPFITDSKVYLELTGTLGITFSF